MVEPGKRLIDQLLFFLWGKAAGLDFGARLIFLALYVC
jgi:hypothetical protein